MNVVLLRVGIDSGSGGIHGPLFADGTFEYLPIPDGFGLDPRTYGNTCGIHGRALAEYFPATMQTRMRNRPMHVDPEFETFTYGEPARGPKSGLRRLEAGDLLVFYCGLEGYDHPREPALYLLGYFEVEVAGAARDLGDDEVRAQFSHNFHVMHRPIYEDQRDRLVLVKGSSASRRFTRAVPISAAGTDIRGTALKVLSPELQTHFGTFCGRLAIQRSTPRWVEPAYVHRAAAFVRSLD